MLRQRLNVPVSSPAPNPFGPGERLMVIQRDCEKRLRCRTSEMLKASSIQYEDDTCRFFVCPEKNLRIEKIFPN